MLDHDYRLREYRSTDEEAVLRLLDATLGNGPTGKRSADLFRWKHVDNPFGPSLMLVAENARRIVGLRAFMRWRFRVGDARLSAVRAVDTATHPEAQGRGIFRSLTMEALELLRGEGVQLVFNTPNERSKPGYLKMGWVVVGSVPVHVRIRRPIRFAWRSWAARSSAGIDVPAEQQQLMEADLPGAAWLRYSTGSRLETDRDLDYLKWRYLEAPGLRYRLCAGPGYGGFVRVRPRGALTEATLADLFVDGTRRAAVRGLRSAAHSALVDHVACAFPRPSPQASALSGSGFVRSPRGMTLVANVLDPGPPLDLSDLRSWALSLGDLEVF